MQAGTRLLTTFRRFSAEVHIRVKAKQSSILCGWSIPHLSQRQGACKRGQGDD